MKIALIDTHLTGHHIGYLNLLKESFDSENKEFFIIAPSEPNFGNLISSEVNFPKNCFMHLYIIKRFFWLKKVLSIAKKENCDLVHFLYLDAFYFTCFLCERLLRNYRIPIVATLHHFPFKKRNQKLLKKFSQNINLVLVHTESIKDKMKSIGLNKVELVDYPVFSEEILDLKECRKNLKVYSEMLNRKIILSIGGTRYNKGLDILLKSLSLVKENFFLIIAGKPEYYDKTYIESEINAYKDSVFLDLDFLSDRKFNLYINSADCVVLPYRKRFDGASGPMTEAIWRRKAIIGPSSGSIGQLIQKYNLGFVFESENVHSLANVLEKYLTDNNPYEWTEKAEKYRMRLSKEFFQKRMASIYLGFNF